MICIYQITCGDDIYIGSTKDLKKRIWNHKDRSRQSKYSHMPLYKKMNEGEYTFDIIEELETDENLIEIEDKYIKGIQPTLNCRGAKQDMERRRLLKNARERKRRQDNKEGFNKKSLERYYKNKEVRLKKQREYRKEHKERLNKRQRELRQLKKQNKKDT